jgi:hypothetical protein
MNQEKKPIRIGWQTEKDPFARDKNEQPIYVRTNNLYDFQSYDIKSKNNTPLSIQ